MDFLALPSEIHLAISDSLPYCDVLALARTCRYLKPMLVSSLYTRAAQAGYIPVLHWAALNHKPEALSLLLDRGMASHIDDEKDGFTPLMQAARTCRVSVNYHDSQRMYYAAAQTSILMAPRGTAQSQYDTVLVLLEHGANTEKLLSLDYHVEVNNVWLIRSTALILAIGDGAKNAPDMVKLLIAFGANPNVVVSDDRTYRPERNLMRPLDWVCEKFYDDSRKSYRDILKILLMGGASIIAPGVERRYTVFHKAVVKGCAEIVKLLLDHGAPIDVRNSHGHTPLAYACVYKQVEIAKLLIDAGADLSVVDNWGFSVLHHAAAPTYLPNQQTPTHGGTASATLVKLLLEKGVDVNLRIVDSPGLRAENTPVFERGYGSKSDEEDMGVLRYRCDGVGATPLMSCCKHTHPMLDSSETVRALLENGADTAVRYNGFTALHYAAARDDSAITRILLEHGADVEAKDGEDEITPLCLAARCPFDFREETNHWVCSEPRTRSHCPSEERRYWWSYSNDKAAQDVVIPISSMNVLLEHGASIEAVDNKGRTIFLHVAGCGRVVLGALDFLRDSGADVNVRYPDGLTLMMDRTIPCDILIDLGVDVESKDKDGMTPLMYACRDGDLEDIMPLLEHGAKPRAKTLDGRYALHFVAAYRTVQPSTDVKEIIDNLNPSKAGIDICTGDGSTALMIAFENWNVETITHLIERGADLGKCAKDGSTMLHYVARSRVNEDRQTPYLQVMQKLKTMDVDARNNDGATPLLLACRVGRIIIVEKLLMMGAHPTLADNDGLDPLAVTKLTRDEAMARQLAGFGEPDQSRYNPAPFETTLEGAEEIIELLLKYKKDVDSGRWKPKPKAAPLPTTKQASKPIKPKVNSKAARAPKQSQRKSKKQEPIDISSRDSSPNPSAVAAEGRKLRERKKKV